MQHPRLAVPLVHQAGACELVRYIATLTKGDIVEQIFLVAHTVFFLRMMRTCVKFIDCNGVIVAAYVLYLIC